MKIKIDEKEIVVGDPSKNIVEIAAENSITITAPCFRNGRKHGCCNTCVIEVDGIQKYACGTKPQDGMKVIYNRADLAEIRKERMLKYEQAIKKNDTSSNKCASSCCCSDSSCCN